MDLISAKHAYDHNKMPSKLVYATSHTALNSVFLLAKP